jgi:hypothetical protein
MYLIKSRNAIVHVARLGGDMSWLNQAFAERSVAWLLLSTAVALLSGILSSWLTYRFVKRREIVDTVRAEIEKQRHLAVIQVEREKKERIRQEVIRWANPILGAVKQLEGRLKNILEEDGYLALSKSYEQFVNPSWSISYEYFINSTLFLFGQYFAWVQMLQEELSFELFQTQQDKDDFLVAIAEVAKSLARFPPNLGKILKLLKFGELWK